MANLRDDGQRKKELFRELYEAYYAPLCLYAFRFVRDMPSAEDIVADIFAALWDRLPDMELRDDTAGGYLRSAVKNRCLNHLKHRLYELGYQENCALREPVYASSADALYTPKELYQMLHRTLERLPENYRTVFVRSILEGRTHDDIAQEMQVSVKSVNRYKQRAIEQLRRELEPYLTLLAAWGAIHTL